MSSGPLLIIVQGAPASGKTTISKRLEKDLDCILLAKDDIKEFLFDRLKQSDRDFSTIQGQASIAMMYAGAKSFLQAGKDTMLESAFRVEFAKAEIDQLALETGANVVEVYCFVDEALRQKRFMTRAANGTRHPAHLDHDVTADMLQKDSNPSIAIGDRFDMDMTNGIDDHAYGALVAAIKDRR